MNIGKCRKEDEITIGQACLQRRSFKKDGHLYLEQERVEISGAHYAEIGLREFDNAQNTMMAVNLSNEFV